MGMACQECGTPLSFRNNYVLNGRHVCKKCLDEHDPATGPGIDRLEVSRMTRTKILFSFDGRIKRSTFWLYGVLVTEILLFYGIGQVLALPGYWIAGDNGAGAAFGISYILSLWPRLAILVKRCHDRNRTGFFLLLVFVPLLNIWCAIELAVLSGTNGANQYGPQPL